jgi:CheY-like chemotaxis protein
VDVNNNQAQKRILIVEDNSDLAEIYSTMLQLDGFAVKIVINGEEALKAALDFHPNLVLLDVMIPVLNGFDVLEILRNTPETTNIKVVMVTALNKDGDIQRAKKLKVDDYLIKSQVSTDDIVEHVKRLLA